MAKKTTGKKTSKKAAPRKPGTSGRAKPTAKAAKAPPVRAKAVPLAAEPPAASGPAEDAGVATTAETGTAPRRRPPKAKRVSALDGAAQVLADAGQPMRAKEIIQRMEHRGLWKSPGGKTPAATLYAAMIREIAKKGSGARFRKSERGLFEASSTRV